eukprot:2917220-Rhodomonas_salina.1
MVLRGFVAPYAISVPHTAQYKIALDDSTIRYLSTAHRVAPYAISVPHALFSVPPSATPYKKSA